MPPRIFAALSSGVLLVIWVEADGAAGVEVLPLPGTDVASVERGVDDGDVGVVDSAVCTSGAALLPPVVLVSLLVDDADDSVVLEDV